MRVPRERWPTILIAFLAFTGFIVVGRLLGSVDIGKELHRVSHDLGHWTYVLVGLAAFLETGAFVGLVLPGESAVILGGAVAGQGATSIVVTIAVVWVCAWGGDTVSFLLGRRLGREFILKHGPKVRITEERFKKVESYFDRYGGRTILIGRFIGLVRALAPFSAGSSGMRYRAFLPYSVLGTGLWSATFCLIGYYASQSIDAAAAVVSRSTFYLGVAAAVGVAAVLAHRFLSEAANRERAVREMESSRLLSPLLALGRRLSPSARFAWNRFTPGDLGLELTTLLATVAVGAFVVIAYATTLGPASGAIAGDNGAFEFASHLSAGWVTHLAKVVTALGSFAVILPLSIGVAVVLVKQRRWTELAVLVAGTVVIFIGVGSIKAAVDRPRPAGALIAIGGSSFPSGHSAHAVLYPLLALLVVRRRELSHALRTTVLAVGVALAAGVGLSRVYLRAHYMSDVWGGWALGFAAFAGVGAIVLVVSYLRETSGPDVVPGGHPH